MIYKKLSPRETSIWIKNINKVIDLNEQLMIMVRARYNFMDAEYQEKYYSGWKRFFYESRCHIVFGNIYQYGSWFFKLNKMTPWTRAELNMDYHTDNYYENWKRKLKMTKERWTKYAEQPFQVEEKDVIFYQEMVEFHQKTIKIAEKLGIEYETYNLDEDRKDSC
ncbi:hypothetical protein pEaSNUABM44_00101 [Erwinia phage pEa_SNUABM_44]|nr:hypothetical protein pEaSNUABM44_00101 [Erwinia phage pEa_SNUABM_44]